MDPTNRADRQAAAFATVGGARRRSTHTNPGRLSRSEAADLARALVTALADRDVFTGLVADVARRCSRCDVATLIAAQSDLTATVLQALTDRCGLDEAKARAQLFTVLALWAEPT